MDQSHSELEYSLQVFDDLLSLSEAISRSSTYITMKSYLVFVSLNQTQGSVLQGDTIFTKTTTVPCYLSDDC